MFIFTARVTKKRLAAAAAALILICGGVIALGGTGAERSIDAAAAVGTSARVKTAGERIAYLESLGWQVAPEPIAVEELLIPEEFDDSYTEYLALQSAQGFDLTEYRGKRVKRYTYEITNYPSGETGVQVSLLIWKNRVVGGEVLSPRLDGFLHGLARPE